MSYYTADPVRDAMRYESNLEAEAERFEEALEEATAEIEQGFATFKPLPYVTGIGKLTYQPFSEAASDLVADDKVWAVMLEALKTSECPKVKAVLAAMQAEYIRMWAADCAGVA